MPQAPERALGASASTFVHSPFSVIFGSPPPCLSMHQTGRPFGTTAQTLSDGATAACRLPDGRLFDRTCASDARGCCCTAPRRLHRSPAPPTPPDRRLQAVSPPRPLPRSLPRWPSTVYYVPACDCGWPPWPVCTPAGLVRRVRRVWPSGTAVSEWRDRQLATRPWQPTGASLEAVRRPNGPPTTTGAHCPTASPSGKPLGSSM